MLYRVLYNLACYCSNGITIVSLGVGNSRIITPVGVFVSISTVGSIIGGFWYNYFVFFVVGRPGYDHGATFVYTFLVNK